MASIVLTQGFFATVDDAEYERLSAYRWKVLRTGKNRYAVRSTSVGAVLMHREILRPKPGELVDHINRNGLDNRRSNLRVCDARQNQWNREKSEAAMTSRFKGVYWNKERRLWQAQINVNGKSTYVGRYASEIEAARAYDSVAEVTRGEFAFLNFTPKRGAR